ncbi:hypothetical protein F5141DRAFT_237652 [Pisolithus sp. B1]|nr:hypothetical protein F5141DRAFT_237652 [Pisolithus sp. B1]
MLPCSTALSASHSLVGSLFPSGQCVSMLRGEVYGLLASNFPSPATVYPDHLPFVRAVLQFLLRRNHRRHLSFRSSPARLLYCWLSDPAATHPFVSLQHVHAHTSSTTPSAQTNAFADLRTTSAQRTVPPPPVPVPTFMMDRFTPFHLPGCVETALSSFTPSSLACLLTHQPDFRLAQVVPRVLYDTRCLPACPSLHATSALSATLQLYLRSTQLDTADKCY